MMKFWKPFLTFIFLGTLIGLKAQGQPGDLGHLEVNVSDRYKANVGEAVKYSDNPEFEDTTTSKLPVNYRIVSQPIEVKYKPEPISPARIAKVPVEELYNGMIKGGFGLYGTPLLEAYWNSGRASDHSFGFWGKHFSTHSGVKQTIYEDNGLSKNEVGAYFNHFYRKFIWESQAFAKFDKYSYYGIDEYPEGSDSAGFHEPQTPDYNWYRQYSISTAITGKHDKNLGWLDKLGMNYYNFSDRYKSTENFFRMGSDWELPAGTQKLDLGLNVSYFETSFDSIVHGKQSYLTIQARPKVSITVNNILFDFGLNLYNTNYNSDLTGGDSKIRFFPEVNVRFPFVEDVLSAYVGIKGDLEHNSFRHLTLQNPYVTPGDTLRPTRTTDIYVGMTGILSSTTSFNVRGGLLNQNDLVLYYRNPFYRLDTLAPGLGVLYDNSQTFYVRGELASNINNNLQAELFGELRGYNTEQQAKAWHLPAFTAGLSVDYTLREKIKLNTELDYTGPREAFAQELNPKIEATLPAYLDMALGVEYLYNSRLSAFLNITNLLNTKYDLYLGYKAQSINFLIGFNYKF